MIINVDIDGVLSKNVVLFCDYISEEFNFDVDPDEITLYDQYIDELDMKLSSIIQHMYENRPEYIVKSETINNSVESVQELYKNNKINIVSHRSEKVADESEEWLDEKGFVYDNVFIDEDMDKTSIEADFMIDDSPYVADNFEDASTELILFPRLYNQHLIEEDVQDVIDSNQEWNYVLSKLE